MSNAIKISIMELTSKTSKICIWALKVRGKLNVMRKADWYSSGKLVNSNKVEIPAVKVFRNKSQRLSDRDVQILWLMRACVLILTRAISFARL